MSVAAWSPLGGGVLSGKFTNGAAADGSTRLSMDAISKHDHTVAQVVQGVADELGVSASQVALAWTMTHSRAVHPIVGVRTLEQLTDNLGALDVVLTPELTARLEAATEFQLGFPHDFIREMQSFVYGEAGSLVDE